MDNIFLQYIEWHFIDSPKGILKGWNNCLKFNLNYWSVMGLLKTFLSPWRRYRFGYGRGLDPGRYFEVFTFNIFSRVLGATLRSVFIILGLASEIFIFFVGLIVIWLWMILPVLLILGFFYGFRILF